jgi:thiol-disulfide isomerase/thioredoxin
MPLLCRLRVMLSLGVLVVAAASCGNRTAGPSSSSASGTEPTPPTLGPHPVGEHAPSFIRPNVITGAPVTLPAQGRPTFLYFWATWGAPDIKALPKLEELHRRYGDRVAVIAVSYDLPETSDEDVRRVLRDAGVNFPVVRDRDRTVSDHYRPASDPSLYVVDVRGKVRRIFDGYRGSDDDAALDAEAAELSGRRDARP